MAKEKDELEIVEDKNENQAVKVLKGILPYLIILVVVVSIRVFIITPVIVSGESMVPKFDGGEVVLLNKLAKNSSYERFDIVVLKHDNDRIIKRVIGLPGETIACENGVIYINDRKIDEDFEHGKTNDFKKVTLKDDEYFVLGDNRPNSLDSEELGPFKKDKILGKPVFVMWPFTKIGKIK